MKELIQAWYDLLNGSITYNSTAIEAFMEDVPEDHAGHYIWIHAEGGGYAGNKSSLADNDVVVIDIVTVFNNNVDRSVCEDIDAQITTLLYSTASINNLAVQSGVQFGQVIRETTAYLNEQDSVNKYYRKVSRYKTRVVYA